MVGVKDVQNDGKSREPLLGGCVLSAAVDLFPEGEVVVDAAVAGEVEGDARDVVEHDVGDLSERESVSEANSELTTELVDSRSWRGAERLEDGRKVWERTAR